MRLEVLSPSGELTDVLLENVIALVDGNPPSAGQIAGWTGFQRKLAYDWAIREYLAASDNPVQRRPRPGFLPQALV
jgi:hypothetical protein